MTSQPYPDTIDYERLAKLIAENLVELKQRRRTQHRTPNTQQLADMQEVVRTFSVGEKFTSKEVAEALGLSSVNAGRVLAALSRDPAIKLARTVSRGVVTYVRE